MEHIHDHTHTHDHGEAFAPAAENLLLDLAMRAHAGTLRTPSMPDVGEIAALEEKYDIKNIRARLGDAYPDMGFMGEAAVILAFAEQADALPTTHSRYDHSHGQDDGCGKTHGPVRRTLETIEQKVLGKIRNQRIKLVAAAAFRGSSLILCPGDDLAAIGLQMYGAFTGHTGHDEHTHTEQHVAVIPRGPRIDFAKGTAVISSLPLGVAMGHKEIPDTPAGRMWRERTSDPESPKPEATMQAKPERKSRRLRKLALVGAAAIAFFGGGLAMAEANHKAPQSAPKTPAVAPSQTPETRLPPKAVEPQQPQIMETIRAQSGDSQWELIEDRVEDALGHKGRVPLINALTHMSVHANKGASIDPGQHVQLPTREVIIKMQQAVQHPDAADPRLVADVHTLNSQKEFESPESVTAIQRIQTYVFS